MSKKILSVLLVVVFVFSFLPTMAMPALAADTGKKLIITHNIDLGDDLILQANSISLDANGAISLDTSDSNKFYRFQQYYPKAISDGSSLVEKGYKLLMIVIEHDGKNMNNPFRKQNRLRCKRQVFYRKI